MQPIVSKLTVLFEDPFWIGLYEVEDENVYSVCKIMFGVEPKDCEVYDLILKSWHKFRFYHSKNNLSVSEKRINPKRRQRMINKQLNCTVIGTKAQQALKLQHEQNKSSKKANKRENKKAAEVRKFNLKQEKRKDKHRGH